MSLGRSLLRGTSTVKHVFAVSNGDSANFQCRCKRRHVHVHYSDCLCCADNCLRDPPDPKRPRLNVPIPGPAPYSVPANHNNASSSSTSSQVMGPPSIRLQSGLYPSPSPSFRPGISPLASNPTFSMPPPPSTTVTIPEDRPQDAEQLQDALASAGVDLKAEEFNLSQIMTPSSAIAPQPNSFVFPHTYGGIQVPQTQTDEGKLIFNRPVLSRFVDRIGIPTV